jgi:hypothetical protein
VEELKHEGAEYSKIINDVLEDHKFKKIKPITSYVLKAICDNYSGTARFITEYCVELISLGTQTLSIDKCRYIKPDDKILKINNTILQLETSLLILCVIADEIIRNYELM